MVVLLVIPSTRTVASFVTSLAAAVLVPFLYVVDDPCVTVTFWPATVVIVNPDEVTLVTVPIEPPSAAPDRALDPPPVPPAPGMPCPLAAGADGVGLDVADGDVAAQPASPIIPSERTAAAIHTLLFFGSDRGPLERAGFFGLVFMISLLDVRKSLSRIATELMSGL
jgi:hypothetical protein